MFNFTDEYKKESPSIIKFNDTVIFRNQPATACINFNNITISFN